MKDRGALYVGILLIAFGGFFLIAQLSRHLWLPFGLRLGWRGLWPFLILLVGFAFWLPIIVWWNRKAEIAGLAVPATIITVNGLILLYQNVTGDWGSWRYAWALEPIAVALGLIVLHVLLGSQGRGLLVAAGIVGGIGLVMFFIFASLFGGVLGLLAPVLLIMLGLFIIVSNLRRTELPQE